MATNETGPVIDRVISRADGLAQLHINYARNANADLNSIMSSLANSTRITIPKINALDSPEDPNETYFKPDTDLSQLFATDYLGTYGELKTWYGELVANAQQLFFPNIEDTLGPETDAWLLKAIKGEAIKLDEDAELNRGRSRAWAEADRAKKQAAGGVAAMGYSLPSGALFAAVNEANYAATNTVYELNRDITIEAQKVRIQIVQAAVAQVNQMRQTAISGLTSYLNAFSSLPGTAVQYAAQKADAKKSLWESGARYYASKVQFQQIVADVGKANLGKDVSLAQLDVSMQDKIIERDLKSLQTAAEVYGRLVAGAMAGINSHVSLSGGASVSDSVSLQYSGQV